MRDQGTVKFFNGQKGYGFIWRDNNEDLFVHISACGNVPMVKGQRVEFDIVTNSRSGKIEAADVRILPTKGVSHA